MWKKSKWVISQERKNLLWENFWLKWKGEPGTRYNGRTILVLHSLSGQGVKARCAGALRVIVHFIKTRSPKYYRVFTALCNGIESGEKDLPVHTGVPWCSLGKYLKEFPNVVRNHMFCLWRRMLHFYCPSLWWLVSVRFFLRSTLDLPLKDKGDASSSLKK